MVNVELSGQAANDDSGRFIRTAGPVLSLSFVEPHKRDRPTRPDWPGSRHAPRNVWLQDL